MYVCMYVYFTNGVVNVYAINQCVFIRGLVNTLIYSTRDCSPTASAQPWIKPVISIPDLSHT